MSPTTAEIRLAYRHLYTHGLRAVQYSVPARYVLRDRLRRFFRSNDPAAFDQRKIDSTLDFLRGAAREKGLEHRIVKSLFRTWWEEASFRQSNRFLGTSRVSGDKAELRVIRTVYDPFYHTIRMLNESMGTCIQ